MSRARRVGSGFKPAAVCEGAGVGGRCAESALWPAHPGREEGNTMESTVAAGWRWVLFLSFKAERGLTVDRRRLQKQQKGDASTSNGPEEPAGRGWGHSGGGISFPTSGLGHQCLPLLPIMLLFPLSAPNNSVPSFPDISPWATHSILQSRILMREELRIWSENPALIFFNFLIVLVFSRSNFLIFKMKKKYSIS